MPCPTSCRQAKNCDTRKPSPSTAVISSQRLVGAFNAAFSFRLAISSVTLLTMISAVLNNKDARHRQRLPIVRRRGPHDVGAGQRRKQHQRSTRAPTHIPMRYRLAVESDPGNGPSWPFPYASRHSVPEASDRRRPFLCGSWSSACDHCGHYRFPCTSACSQSVQSASRNLRRTRYGEFIRSAINHRQHAGEVVVRRRRSVFHSSVVASQGLSPALSCP